MFKWCTKKKLSPAEIKSELLKQARKYGIDPQSLTTSMGGITTDNTNLYIMVNTEKSRRQANQAFWISIIALLVSIIEVFKPI